MSDQQQQQTDALAAEMHGSEMQHFKGMNPDPNFIMLDLRYNRIENFYGFPSLPNLQCLRLDGNRVDSFLGMSFQPNLQVLTLAGNPISEHPDYRILALLACGNNLREIDGKVVTKQEKEVADSVFGGVSGNMAQLISLGYTQLDENTNNNNNSNSSRKEQEWIMEKCRAEFLQTSKRMEESRSFGSLAPTNAEILSLGAGTTPEANQAALAVQTTTAGTKRELHKFRSESTDSNEPPYYGGLHRSSSNNSNSPPKGSPSRGGSRRSARAAAANADLYGGTSQTQNNNNAAGDNDYDVRNNINSSRHPSQEQQLPLTNSSVNHLLHPQQTSKQSNFISAEQSKFGATQMMMKDRADQLLSTVKIPHRSDQHSNPVAVAREFAKAFQHVSPAPSSLGPSPVSAFGISKSPLRRNNLHNNYYVGAGGREASTTRVSGNDLNLVRDDVTNFSSIELTGYDISAQWQPPKNGTIQIVRATLRINFDFGVASASATPSSSPNSNSNRKNNISKPKLAILDDAAQVVAVFSLPVSRIDHPQSVWINDGDPPAIALCSDEEDGNIDVVIMPSAGTKNATARSQTLHKLLIHAMAEYSSSTTSASSKNNINDREDEEDNIPPKATEAKNSSSSRQPSSSSNQQLQGTQDNNTTSSSTHHSPQPFNPTSTSSSSANNPTSSATGEVNQPRSSQNRDSSFEML